MALTARLARELRTILRQFRAANGPSTVPTSSGKALEAWLALRLARRAQASGRWTVTLRRGDETPVVRGSTFRLPASQAGILKANALGPGYILLERVRPPRIKLELHLSLQWKGRSDATHECDVSLVPEAIAHPLRAQGGHPRGLPPVAFECKDRTTAGGSDEMRQTLARLFDLALVTRPYPGWNCRIFEATSATRWGKRSSQYRPFFATGAFAIVRVGGFHKGARELGQHYHIGRLGNVYRSPAAIDHAENSFMRVLDGIDFI